MNVFADQFTSMSISKRIDPRSTEENRCRRLRVHGFQPLFLIHPVSIVPVPTVLGRLWLRKLRWVRSIVSSLISDWIYCRRKTLTNILCSQEFPPIILYIPSAHYACVTGLWVHTASTQYNTVVSVLKKSEKPIFALSLYQLPPPRYDM